MKFLFGLFLLVFNLNAYSQIDSVGSGRAITLDGLSDYVKVGNYKDINLPFTVSAWINVDPTAIGTMPIFVTNDVDQVYRGFWFSITATNLFCEYGDGNGVNNPAFRHGKVASINNVFGRWTHVCVVMASYSNISLYINGIDVGGTFSGESNLPMASSSIGDTGKIGYFLTNGGQIFHFKGSIDEVRLWNRALTQAEVIGTMCKKMVGNETGLVGYWNFNETTGTTAIDNSPAQQNGTLIGNIQRGFSGAALGNITLTFHSLVGMGTAFAGWPPHHLSIDTNLQGSNLENIVIVYEVKNLPSQTGGLDLSKVSSTYMGVFFASRDARSTFNVTYSYNGVKTNQCQTFVRTDNSVATWTSTVNPMTYLSQRTEIIYDNGFSTNLDLGPNRTLCDGTTATTLSTGLDGNQYSFLWNTGQITSSITVNQSGEYSVVVSGVCGSVKDSVEVLFEEMPPAFSLGIEKSDTLCKFTPVILKPFQNSLGYQFVWQDNSTDSLFNATTFGKYWVTVKNSCGESSDTITFLEAKKPWGLVPNAITPNDGNDKNQFFKINNSLAGEVSLRVFNRWGREVYNSSAYNNDWDGGNLDSGVYYFVLSGECVEEYKSWISIIR